MDISNIRINRNARLIVRNVSFKAKEESLREHFAPYGDVHEVKLLKKPDGKLVGCAFIQYKNVPMAKKALLSTNMKPFLGRPISVDWAVAKNEYMKHIDQKHLELQEKVKQEDSDSDDEKFDITNDSLKAEVKSEADEDSDSDQKPDIETSDDEESVKDEHSVTNEGSSDEEDDENDAAVSDDQSQVSSSAERKRTKLNDAEDGCTVFITNISFNVDNDQLKKFAEKTGPVRYALICVDKLTEHSRGTGFVKFMNKEDADKFMSLPSHELKVDGQILQVKPALKKESLSADKKKQPKDNRNLYLVKEGVVVAGTRAAVGVSASDMAKRLALERSKTQMLKNLNRFVSRYRLVVSNLPPNYDDAALRKLCVRGVPAAARVTEARVMRDLRAPVTANGKHPSKGYGFVMWTRHEDALACLRRLNNNPDVFGANNRPIVSFSIEDRTALNARKKRLAKSIENNPINKKDNVDAAKNRINNNKKRKNNTENPDESKSKKGKFEKTDKMDKGVGKFVKVPDESKFKMGKFEKKDKIDNEVGKFVRLHNDEANEYTGLTAKEGAQHKMRSNHKLKTQADTHRQNLKMEKKKSKKAMKLKMAARERIKQPKQKINKNTKKNKDGNKNKIKNIKETASFSDLVSKYKSKLAGNSLERVKAKWYEP